MIRRIVDGWCRVKVGSEWGNGTFEWAVGGEMGPAWIQVMGVRTGRKHVPYPTSGLIE